MTISGTLTVLDNNQQNHVIQADDFTLDPHLDGRSTSVGFDDGNFSVEIIVENKNGAVSLGNWETKNCSVTQDNITFHP